MRRHAPRGARGSVRRGIALTSGWRSRRCGPNGIRTACGAVPAAGDQDLAAPPRRTGRGAGPCGPRPVLRLGHHARWAAARGQDEGIPEGEGGEQSRRAGGRGAPPVCAVAVRGAGRVRVQRGVDALGRNPRAGEDDAVRALGLDGAPRPGGTMPYGPLALTVLRGPGGARPYGPLALTVLCGPGDVTADGASRWGGLVTGDAPAAAGIARNSVQALAAMRRVRMVTSKGLESRGADRVGDATMPPRLVLARAERERCRRRGEATPEVQNVRMSTSVTNRLTRVTPGSALCSRAARRARVHRLRSGPTTRAGDGTMHRGVTVLVMGWSSDMRGRLGVRRAARMGRIDALRTVAAPRPPAAIIRSDESPF